MVSEHLVRLQRAKEVEDEEYEVNASIDTASEDAHPSVVVLNGPRLEDDQYVCISVNAWIVIDRCSLGGD